MVAPAGDAPRLAAPDLAGRVRELAAVVRAARCPPALVLVEGEAGAGKSRLVRELCDSERSFGRRALIGRCHPVREPFPLGAVLEALRGLAGERSRPDVGPVTGALSKLLPELEDWLPPAAGPLGDPRAERHRLLRAVLELLGALGPTLLVLEDLHWADAATVELLEYLVCQLPPELSLVLTYRREQLDAGAPVLGLASRAAGTAGSETVALGALDRDELRLMVESMLGGAPAAERLVELLHHRTGGNPFAVEQLVRLLVDRGALIPGEPGWTLGEQAELGVPTAVRDAVLERVGLLSAGARSVIEAAVLLALPAAESLLGSAAGLTSARTCDAICEALASGVLRVGAEGQYLLCHALAGQAVDEAIPPPRRRRLHLRAARALEAGGGAPAARLAHHYKEAGSDRLWPRHAERAADELAAIGADRDAARLLRHALSAPQLPPGTQARIATKLADASIYARNPRPAVPVLQALLGDGSLPRSVRGRLALALGRLLIEVGEQAGAWQLFREAAEDLRRVPEQRARALARLGTWTGGAADGLARTGAGCAGGDPVLMTEVLGARAIRLLCAGDPAGWRTLERLPARVESREHGLELVRAYKHAADAACLLGHCARAEALLERGERIRGELGHERFGVGLATARLRLDWRTGRWEGLEERAVALIDSSPDSPMWRAFAELIAAWLWLSRGAVEQAEQGFERCRAVFREADALWHGITAASGLSAIRLARGRPRAALDALSPELETVRRFGCWHVAYAILPPAVEALCAVGEPAEAGALVRRVEEGLRGRDVPAAQAAVALCRGTLADASGGQRVATRHYAQAERAWRAVPAPYEAARARERRGRSRLAAQDRRGAEDLLAALKEHERLGARWDAARVRRALREHGIALPYPWRGGPRGYGSALSPREREVARLVAAGQTNREIAQGLFLSPRTVDRHVAAAMRKLRVGSRRELDTDGNGSAATPGAAGPINGWVIPIGEPPAM